MRKKNEEIKGQINSNSLNTVYTIHLSLVHMCAKFHNLLGLTVPEKSVTKMLMFENWRERKMKNKGMNKQQQPDSGKHDTSAHCTCVPSFNLLGHTVSEKSVTTKCKCLKIGEKEK